MAEADSPPRKRDILVVGGSSGSLSPLRDIVGGLSATEITVFVARHLAVTEVPQTELLGAHARFSVSLAVDGARHQPRNIYLAPADRHLVLDGDVMRVFRGPRENGARPSIDALFRSAAVHFGPRTTGVLLSGRLFDGSAGLQAIRRCGGVAIVQDPSDAIESELPRSALELSAVDHCLPVSAIVAKLAELASEVALPYTPVPEDLQIETRLALASAEAHEIEGGLQTSGDVAHLTCPECDGPLFRVEQGALARYHCEVGHAFSGQTLLVQQSRRLERALWVALRTLEERKRLLLSMAQQARERGQGSSNAFEERARELDENIRALRSAVLLAPRSGPTEVEGSATDRGEEEGS